MTPVGKGLAPPVLRMRLASGHLFGGGGALWIVCHTSRDSSTAIDNFSRYKQRKDAAEAIRTGVARSENPVYRPHTSHSALRTPKATCSNFNFS